MKKLLMAATLLQCIMYYPMYYGYYYYPVYPMYGWGWGYGCF